MAIRPEAMDRDFSARLSPVGLEKRLGVFVAIVCTLLFANNLLPYVGLRDDSCQTMFSGLDWSDRWNNHVFMPQRALSDRWSWLEGVDVEVEPAPRDPRSAHLARFLDRSDRRLNIDAVRAALSQLCADGHRVRLEHRRGARVIRHANACDHDHLSRRARWIPVRLYETDLPAP
jgi:hypothetical protein